MDNQHRYIAGYRELSQAEIEAMNDIKRLGNTLGNLIESLRHRDEVSVDEGFLQAGKMDIQKGLMVVTRSIAQPKSF